jgi:hypothetical protein
VSATRKAKCTTSFQATPPALLPSLSRRPRWHIGWRQEEKQPVSRYQGSPHLSLCPRPRDEIKWVRLLPHYNTSASRCELQALSLASSAWCCLKMEACLFDSKGRLRRPTRAPCSPHARVIRLHLSSLGSIRGQKEVCMPIWSRGPLVSVRPWSVPHSYLRSNHAH